MSKKVKMAVEEMLEEAIISKDDQLFNIPENWVWTTLGSITEVIGGGTPKSNVKDYYDNGNIPWITPADLSRYNNMFINEGNRNITQLGLEKSSARLLPKNTVLLSSRAPIGYVVIADNEVSTNQGFKSFLPSVAIYPQFLYWYLKNSKAYLESMASGSTFKEISGSKCKNINFPLPPLNEQKRIADKVEGLLNKIDEAKQLIDEAKETVELRRAAILDKAFSGELTLKWRKEKKNIEPAHVLLESIKDKKLNSDLKINTNKIESVGKNDEPFTLPNGWIWVRLGELAYYVTSGSRDWSKYYSNSGAYFIRTQDINTNKLVLENVAYMELPEQVEGKRSLLEKDDLLTTITGANVGKCARVDFEIPEAYVSQSVALTKLVDKRLSEYLHYSLISPSGGGGELKERAYGIGRPVLSLEDVKNIKIPLAPFDEQREIIYRIDRLLKKEDSSILLIDNLEKELNGLKNSILSKAFRSELGTNDPTEESSIELLKELLNEQVK